MKVSQLGTGKKGLVMAKANSNVATDEQANGTAPEGEGSENKRSGRIYVVVPMTAELKQIIVDQANKEDRAVGIVARDMLAKHLNVEVPVVTSSRPHKYGSEEERKTARKSALKERNALVKALLAKLKSGEVQLSPAEIEAAKASASASTNGTAGESVAEAPAPAPEGEAVPA